MNIQKILVVLMVIFAIVFITLQMLGLEFEAAGIRPLLLMLLTTLYWNSAKEKRFFFLMFLSIYFLAEVINFVGWLSPVDVESGQIDYLYYISNALFITSYSFLIAESFSSMNVDDIFDKYMYQICILVVLDVISVVVVTHTVIDKLPYSAFFVEFVYNAVIMILLSVTLLNYYDKDDQKSLVLFIGSVFILFSEFIQLAYFYISTITMLNVVCSMFLVLAFVFFYFQTTLTCGSSEDSLTSS